MPITADATIPTLFQRQVERWPDRPALGMNRADAFQWLTWSQVDADVRRFAIALTAAGMVAGDHLAVLSENRYEWVLLDLAAQTLGIVTVPLHATLAAEQIAAQLQHGECTVVVCSNETQAEKLARCCAESGPRLPCLTMDPVDVRIGKRRPTPLKQLLPDKVDDRAWGGLLASTPAGTSPDQLATILYTSGTSGQPKGVMLSQGNLAANARATFPATGETADDVKLGFLPLSHIFARTCDLYISIACGNQLALAESVETVIRDCHTVRPTWINGVPYFFDMVRRRLEQQAAADNPGSLRSAFGGRIRSCQCGGAPVSRGTYDFYWNRGVPIFPGYGLTEASPVISVSAPGHVRHGWVGQAIRDIDVRISAAGEILTRGPHVMQGYWREPQATASTVVDGWLRTGDLGERDASGLLRITGRLRELIVTTGGKNVVPSTLESLLEEDPLIEQAMVTGDGRDFLSALVVPNYDRLRQDLGAAYANRTNAGLSQDTAARRTIEDCLSRRLACVSRYERIGRFALLERPFTIESGELTAKRSLRRSVIEARNRDVIEAFYRRTAAPIETERSELPPASE